MLKLLGKPQPLELLNCLIGGERDVSQLANALELDHANVSPTLKVLHQYAMVDVQAIGSRHYYRLGPAIQVRCDDGKFSLEVRTSDEGTIALSVPAAKFQRRQRPALALLSMMR